MKKLLITVLVLLPTFAMAQVPSSMYVLPKPLVDGLRQWLIKPDPLIAVQLFAALSACMDANNGGHQGGIENCPNVIAAIKELNSTKTPDPAPTVTSTPAKP